MSLTKSELKKLGWHDLGKQSPRYWSFTYPGPLSSTNKTTRIRLLALLVGGEAVKFWVLYYKKGQKGPIQDWAEDANFSAPLPLIAKNSAFHVFDTVTFYYDNGYRQGDLEKFTHSLRPPRPLSERSKGERSMMAAVAEEKRSIGDAAVARPMSSRSFRAAMGGPYVGEKFMVLSAVTDEPEERRVKRIVAHYPDGKWEIEDTRGDVHVLSWKGDRKNPSHGTYSIGDIVAYKAAFLRSAGWSTNVPKNGKVLKVRGYVDGWTILTVKWSNGHTADVNEANLILYSKIHLEPN